MTEPFISICIPAYKRTDYLKRLLLSIAEQDFQDFQVIITDDSPDDSVTAFLQIADFDFPIVHHRNERALGTPENWNEGIRRATGKWIKIMHDDDWFASGNSLRKFADAALNNPDKFIFSAYRNNFLDENRIETVIADQERIRKVENWPTVLFASNIIGPPSVCLHRNGGKYFYDKQTKWLVDIDFYIRRLQEEKIFFINEPLVNVGMSAEQVTQACFRNPQVEIPEHFHLLSKMSLRIFLNWRVYDAWWRLFRNLNIRSINDIRHAGYIGEIPVGLQRIISFQSRIPLSILKIGAVSKMLMYFHFSTHKHLFKS